MLSESDTRAKLIDPAIHARGWTEDLIRREETAGAIDVIDGRAKRRSKGRTDYTLRVRVNAEAQPVAMALIEAKREGLPPGHGMEQAKAYAAAKRLNVPFVFSSNGHLFVEYDRFTGIASAPRPMSEFPTPDQLRARYEQHMGFSLESPEYAEPFEPTIVVEGFDVIVTRADPLIATQVDGRAMPVPARRRRNRQWGRRMARHGWSDNWTGDKAERVREAPWGDTGK